MSRHTMGTLSLMGKVYVTNTAVILNSDTVFRSAVNVFVLIHFHTYSLQACSTLCPLSVVITLLYSPLALAVQLHCLQGFLVDGMLSESMLVFFRAFLLSYGMHFLAS